ncbi:hypothetical protein CDV36_008816 [Fusarium kuroshium]|uniref:Uncharacterized protein n=1 Tax=Fusarium kuroshium TaxID=2010991 RepID=A0A3M2S202_9HYPO|nr:hypothetical protein CDV36_008816 [Fusarium kuroshium]
MVMETDKKLFKSLAVSNSELANEIRQVARSRNQQNGDDIAIKALLLRLYNSIVRLAGRRGHPPAPNKTIVEAYHSFFEPTEALAGLPMGDFLAARMFLYLSSALIHDKSLNLRFSESKAPAASAFLHEFCIELDDGLLEPLKRVWIKDNLEQFHWVFSECPVQRSEVSAIDPARYPDLVQALSPEELTAAGGKGRQWLRTEPKDEPVWKIRARLPDLDDEDTENLLWKCIGTDGPICSGRIYRTLSKDAGEESLHSVPVLRRSRQFILDARQISKPLLTKQGRYLLAGILFRAGIPTEIREMIWQYMREPPPRQYNYLTGLDIASAYTPFPKVPEPCQECKERKLKRRDKSIKETCPEHTIYVWNLPLRMFHVLHPKGKSGWWPCAEGLECCGHHDDEQWRLRDQDKLLGWIDSVILDRNYECSELDDLGTVEPTILLNPKEDEERRERLFSENGPFKDVTEQRKMEGGLCGPLSMMAHKAAVIKGWNEGRERGIETAEVQWALGRNLVEQGKAEDTMKKLWHESTRFCWFCRG